MVGLSRMRHLLDKFSDSEHYLFTVSDWYAVYPELNYPSLKALVSRAVKGGLLVRVCAGIYLNLRASYPKGLILFHTAARLREEHFNYLSLESVLSEAGVISQIPMNWITLMTSGRSYTFSCGAFGRIEFIHTKRLPAELVNNLAFDFRYHLWRANVKLALEDMRHTGRPTDLIDWSVANELV